MDKILLKIGGGFHLFCAVLHIFFPAMFKWSERIAHLAGEDALVISANLSIMNYCLLVFWVILAYIPLFHTEELLETGIGRALLTGIVLFWAVRIFLLQPLYIGYDKPESLGVVAVFLAGMALFAVPWVRDVLLPLVKRT